MPTYSFECSKCGKITEKFYASYKLRPRTVGCDECANVANFVIDAPAIHWRHTPKDPFRMVPDNPVKSQVPSNYGVTVTDSKPVPQGLPDGSTMKKKLRNKGRKNYRTKRKDKNVAVKEF